MPGKALEVEMHFEGLLIGLGTIFIIGILHPIVIKAEYHFGTKVWPMFLIFGLICVCISLFFGPMILSAILSILGFSLLWSIWELFRQEQRVEKGWFPKKPKKTTH
jgi:hypothetical protein